MATNANSNVKFGTFDARTLAHHSRVIDKTLVGTRFPRRLLPDRSAPISLRNVAGNWHLLLLFDDTVARFINYRGPFRVEIRGFVDDSMRRISTNIGCRISTNIFLFSDVTV